MSTFRTAPPLFRAGRDRCAERGGEKREQVLERVLESLSDVSTEGAAGSELTGDFPGEAIFTALSIQDGDSIRASPSRKLHACSSQQYAADRQSC